MREILFRGKRKDNGEWVEGSLLKVTINGKTAYLIFGDNFSFDGNDVKALSHALVDPDTVGQYTGMTDKNGKRMFEGDIVVDEDTGNIRTVEYRRNRFVFVSLLRHFFDVIYEEDWEVIGNIHDNPELIGGAE